MKLRVRSLESKETLKIEVPSTCSLHQLKEHLSQAITASSSSLHLSLNRKEELDASSPNAPIQSLGITSGDLVFYSVNPSSFSPPTLDSSSSAPQQQPEPPPGVGPSNLDSQEPKIENPEISAPTCSTEATPEPKVENFETPVGDLIAPEKSEGKDSNLETGKEVAETHESADAEDMDVDFDGSVVMGKKSPEPCFLRRALREELGGRMDDQKLLVIAVHAVLLETGFVGFDSASGLRVDRLHLQDECPNLSLWYTLPELLADGTNSKETVVVKFISLGQTVNVYGSLAKGGSRVHGVCLNKSRFSPPIGSIWAEIVGSDRTNENDESSSLSYPETQVFEFWKMVKDGLALPLLIDICERAGFMLPPCFMCLPTEIKVKILESLCGVDLARVGCACSELLYLSSNNDLWKQKFLEEFGNSVMAREGINWKQTFASSLEQKKKRKRDSTRWLRLARPDRPHYFPARRDPGPLGFPGMLGGDYDLNGILPPPSFPFGLPGSRLPRFRRNFSPNCNLGGFNG